MAPPKPTVPTAATPKHGNHFDSWNSSSTGHQTAENRLCGSTTWRQSRSLKLSHQLKSGQKGGRRLADQVGAGSDNWDEKTKSLVPKDERRLAKVSVRDMLMPKIAGAGFLQQRTATDQDNSAGTAEKAIAVKPHASDKRIFDGLVIYINGSTHPLISDHKLKQLLAENGARISIYLGRRQVTHVILGRPYCTTNVGRGAGGGLAATKIQKEIKRASGCGVKYVGVEWALESLKAGIRLPETQFSNLKVAAKRQQSVHGMFKISSSHGDSTNGETST